MQLQKIIKYKKIKIKKRFKKKTKQITLQEKKIEKIKNINN